MSTFLSVKHVHVYLDKTTELKFVDGHDAALMHDAILTPSIKSFYYKNNSYF